MGNAGNDWGSFMQGRPMRLALNGLCTIFCAYYAVDAVLELASPERSSALVEALGAPGYYALTVVRLAVCAWAAVAFARATARVAAERGEDER